MKSASYNKEMIFPQKLAEPENFQTSLRFFQNLLRSESPCQLSDEYPLVFRPETMSRIYIKKAGDQIVAGLATLDRSIEVEPGKNLRALFVGSVVTDPTMRLHGFQKELFHALEEDAEKEGIDFILLWSSQIQFYEKMGFFLGGLQATWAVTNQSPLAAIPQGVRIEDTSAIELSKEHYEAFCSKSHIVQRSFEDMQLLWKIPQMKVAFTPKAYALLGKGEDFQGVCHEWAGPADEVLSCIEALRTLHPQLKILTPGVLHTEQERVVVQRLEESSYDCRLEYLGLIKIMNDRLRQKDFDPVSLRYPFFIWGLDSI